MKHPLLCVLFAYSTSGVSAPPNDVTVVKSGMDTHDHDDSFEAQAIHATALAWETDENQLSASTQPISRIPNASRIDVRRKKRRTNGHTPAHSGIVIDGKLYMGIDAVTTTVLNLWNPTNTKMIPPGDLAWLAEFGGRCRITAGPTTPAADPQCVGHAARSTVLADGRPGVRYWRKCSGGMRPTQSQTKWLAWINPDQTIERTRVGSCDAGSFRPAAR